MARIIYYSFEGVVGDRVRGAGSVPIDLLFEIVLFAYFRNFLVHCPFIFMNRPNSLTLSDLGGSFVVGLW